MKTLTFLLLLSISFFSACNQNGNNAVSETIVPEEPQTIDVQNIDWDVMNCIPIMLYIDSNLAPGEPLSFMEPRMSTRVDCIDMSNNGREMYKIGFVSGSGNMGSSIYFRGKDGKFRMIFENYGLRLLADSTNGFPNILAHEKNAPIGSEFYPVATLAFNGTGYDTIFVEDFPFQEYVKAGRPGFQYFTEIDSFDMKFRILGGKNKYLIDEIEIKYPVEKDDLFTLFMKEHCRDTMHGVSTHFRFVGFLPSFIIEHKPYGVSFDHVNINGIYYPVFKTLNIENSVVVYRLFYYDGKKYVGKIQPMVSIAYYQRMKDFNVVMDKNLGFEILVPK